MTAVTRPIGQQEPAGQMKIHTVTGGGLRLHVREWGPADGPPTLSRFGGSGRQGSPDRSLGADVALLEVSQASAELVQLTGAVRHLMEVQRPISPST